jgi:hypothetical protein
MLKFPCFKFLFVMKIYVGHADCIFLPFKYDENVVISLLMMVFEILNLIVQACVLANLNWSWHKGFTNFMKVEYLLTK